MINWKNYCIVRFEDKYYIRKGWLSYKYMYDASFAPGVAIPLYRWKPDLGNLSFDFANDARRLLSKVLHSADEVIKYEPMTGEFTGKATSLFGPASE